MMPGSELRCIPGRAIYRARQGRFPRGPFRAIYTHSDIYKGLVANPCFKDVNVRDFGVLEGPPRITRGAAEAPLRTAN
jgi:hypothetical protein